MASGHVNRAHRGRTHGRTDQYCRREESPCQLGAVHTGPWYLSASQRLREVTWADQSAFVDPA
jgi:hypothetical protein